MDWIKLLFNFLKEVIPTMTTFMVGRKSKELEQLEDENEKLKKYNDIEADEHSRDDTYNAGLWK